MKESKNQTTPNTNRLFYGSCLALITTAFSFSLRAGILPDLGEAFELTAKQLGEINSMWFFGFPIAMIIGGLTYHSIGPKKIMQFAFIAHTMGIILTIYSAGYWGLMFSTLLIGLGNGCTEAACNPMISDSATGKKMSTLLNRFHMWFPGGIVLGSLLSYFMTQLNMGWQAQIWIILVPTILYAFFFYGQVFPKPSLQEAKTLKGNLKGMATPLFIYIAICMALTASTEFVPMQWVRLVLDKSGANGMVIMALISGIMAFGRYFGGEFVDKFDQTGVLLASAIFATLGMFLLSTQIGALVYVSAAIFAIGLCYFWPNMIGFVAEKIPKSGALGMSVVGAIGMFLTANMQPVFGIWIDAAREKATIMGLSGDPLDLAVGQETLKIMIAFPALLVVLFSILWFWVKKNRVKNIPHEEMLPSTEY
ncbi:MFS transporter [Maribacter arenosus]|uniref:MFS transporter n=1 Tax=Maribacter arenosus TaxID=1854708 RepID=A0ABR7V681_9FLAO|nr:MFS transporter [Maribacter arenosus]MBD0849203.1 MFS transporter [Maribacter arenosus]